MTDCPICGLPMAWSETQERVWCAVYGDHRTAFQGRNVMRSRLSTRVIHIDFDRKTERNLA